MTTLPSDILDFAEWFSKNYKTLSSDVHSHYAQNNPQLNFCTYIDKTNKYKIEYYDVIFENDKPISSPISVNLNNGDIRISKYFFTKTEKSNENWVLYSIIWCFCCGSKNDLMRADLLALKYYIQLKKPIKDILFYSLAVFSKSPSEQNRNRYKAITKFIDEQK